MKSFNRIRLLNQTIGEVICQKNLKNVVVADIATDHGYLSELLSRNENISKIIATDISQKCLDKTNELIKQNNLSKIETILGDGLEPISGADICVMAGIGGYEIIKMLSNQNITKYGENKCNFFVFQPSKNAVELRKFLFEKNIKIERDFIIKSGGKFYPIICANFLEKNDSEGSLFDLYFGKSNDLSSKAFCEFLLDVIDKFSFTQNMDKERIKKDADLSVKFELFKLANSIIKNKGE